MKRKIPENLSHQVKAQTAELRKKLLSIDLISLGTLHQRTKECGKAGCRCHTSKAARHGPYFEWTRYENGKLAHSVVSERQARLFEAAIANWHRVEELLSLWRAETVRVILEATDPN